MSTIEIIGKIESLKEWESLQQKAAEMVESIKDEIKRHMNSMGEDVYKRFCKETISRRFSISG